MASVRLFNRGRISGSSLRAFVMGIVIAGSLGPRSWSKEPSLIAIELFDGASGPAYVQVTDVLINGKTELRICAGAESGSIEKSGYNKFPKTGMGPGGVLERGADGILRYTQAGGPATCVVPENMKFEHNATFTAAAMADSADLRARAARERGERGRAADEKGRKAGVCGGP